MKRYLYILLTCFALLTTASTLPQTPITPLPIDQAFQLTATAKNNETIILTWTITPGYFLYRDRFQFKVIKPAGTQLGQPLLPHAVKKTSPVVGTYHVYAGTVNIPIAVINTNKKQVVVEATYQGCSQAGYCYPPTSRVVTINLAGHYGVSAPSLAIDVPPAMQKANGPAHAQLSKLAQLLKDKSLFVVLLGFLGFGVLVSFTPCVLPMIPILSGIIIGQKKMTAWHGFTLSLFYVLGMAITYAIAGVLFGVIGGSVQTMMQQPWIIVLFSALFVVMALSLFGFYNIELPQFLRAKIAHASEHQKGGTYLGAALMGCFSTLILSPCVTPPLVAVLGYISQTGDATLGGLALFVMGIGMGTPLLIIGASGGKYLPHAGAWMNIIKNAMGILLLGVALFMLERILPGKTSMILWAALLIGTAIYMKALSTAVTRAQRFSKAIGLVLFVYGIVIVIGAFMGNTNPLFPVTLTQLEDKTQKIVLPFKTVKTIDAVKRQVRLATRRGKPTMLDFYADWCIACKEMEHSTFSHPKVARALSHYVLLRADVTKNDADDKALERYFKVVAPPTILFFDRKGQEVKSQQVVGFISAKQLLKRLSKPNH